MKDKMVAYCGLDCEKCEARIATLANDDAMRQEVARKWCAMNNTDQITPESINCMGCRTEGAKFYYCSHMCEIRKCASAKGVQTCGECADKNSCAKLAQIISTNTEARENIACQRH